MSRPSSRPGHHVLVLILALLCVVIVRSVEAGGKKPDKSMRPASIYKTFSNATARFDANNLGMSMRNSGQLIDAMGGPGCEWPRDTYQYVIYTGGLWLAGKVNDSLRIAAVQYDTSCFQPGIMRFGVASNAADTSYRFYTIRRSDSTGIPDYDAWPINQGAPTSGGLPLRKGDENFWCVYNDGRILGREFRTRPLRVEIQQYVYGDSSVGDILNNPPNNTVYSEFRICNRDTVTIDSVFISLWLDADIGESTDDVTGVDTSLSLAYCYNGRDSDAVYGLTPPAVGLLVLRSPDGFVPPAMAHSFVAYNPSLPGTFPFPANADEAYNYLRGLTRQGTTIVDPTTSHATRFMYSGDPTTHAGWIDTTAEEKAMIFSFGPFTLSGRDSTVFHTAIVVARGTDRLNSVAALKQAVPTVLQGYTSKLVSVRSVAALPAGFALMQNYPNPFNPSTTIRYELPRSSRVLLRVYDVLGRLVGKLVDSEENAGVHVVPFDAQMLANGVYFYRLETDNISFVKKMVVVK